MRDDTAGKRPHGNGLLAERDDPAADTAGADLSLQHAALAYSPGFPAIAQQPAADTAGSGMPTIKFDGPTPHGAGKSGTRTSGWSTQQIGPTRDRPGTSGLLANALAEQSATAPLIGEKAYKLGLKVARRAMEEAEERGRRTLPPNLEIVLFDARFHNSRALAKLHVDAWRATYRGIMPDKVIKALNYRRFEEKWEQLLSQDDPEVFTFMAVDPDYGLLGFLRAGPNEDPDAVSRKEIYALNVAPKFQRRGIGALLLREAFWRIVQDAHWRVEAGIDDPEDFQDNAFLWVMRANQKTRWFMKSMGGRQAGTGEDMIGSERLAKVAYCWTELDDYLGPDFESQLLEQSRHP